jgi:hypothetical protein
MVDTPTGIVLYNPSSTDEIEVDEIGVYLAPLSTVDITHFGVHILSNATELQGMVSNATVQIVFDQSVTPPTPWAIACALPLLTMGVNSFQVGLQKATNPGVVSDRFYSFVTDTSTISPLTISGNNMYAVPLNIFGTNFNRIGIGVAANTANGSIRLGIYSNTDGLPDKLLVDAGVVPTDTLGNKEIVIDFLSPLDWYWLTAVSSIDVSCFSSNSGAAAIGAAAWGSNTAVGEETIYAFSSLPDTFPHESPPSDESTPPVIWLRSASS